MARIPILSSIGWLLLLMVFIKSESRRPVERFGCTFDDRDLNKWQAFPARPQFGDLDPEDLLQIKDYDDNTNFMLDINNFYNAARAGSDFDSLSDYLEFYKTYQTQKNEQTTVYSDSQSRTHFQNFYERYTGSFGPNHEPGGSIIALMKNIVKKYPNLKKSSYFISRSEINSGVLENLLDGTITNVPNFFQHDQIAAIIKYKVPYSDPENPDYAYILLDLEIGATTPICFNEDDGGYFPNGNIIFQMVPSVYNHTATNFITATVTEDNPEQSSSQGSETAPNFYVYYYGRPYCSFMETTIKPNLLKPFHSRRKYKKGVEAAKVLAHVPNIEGLTTTGIKPEQHFQINLNTLPILWFKFPEDKEFIMNVLQSDVVSGKNGICKALGIKRCRGNCVSYWVDKIETLQEIFADTTFQEECLDILTDLAAARTNVNIRREIRPMFVQPISPWQHRNTLQDHYALEIEARRRRWM